jgi:hypothetical protein
MRQIQVDVGPEHCSRANEQGKQRDDDPTTIFAPPQPPLGRIPIHGYAATRCGEAMAALAKSWRRE